VTATNPVPAAWIESIGGFRLPPRAQRRRQSLMDRNNGGWLPPSDEEEWAVLAALSGEIPLRHAEALNIPAKRTA